jgi:hypothetical protein
MEVKGTVKMIGDKQQVSDKFAKRDFVVTDGTGMYPQDILFQATQDKCDLLDTVKVGQEVTVHFNLRGREWVSPQGEVKYFNTLEAWRIEAGGGVTHKEQLDAKLNAPLKPIADELPKDDLPF